MAVCSFVCSSSSSRVFRIVNVVLELPFQPAEGFKFHITAQAKKNTWPRTVQEAKKSYHERLLQNLDHGKSIYWMQQYIVRSSKWVLPLWGRPSGWLPALLWQSNARLINALNKHRTDPVVLLLGTTCWTSSSVSTGNRTSEMFLL